MRQKMLPIPIGEKLYSWVNSKLELKLMKANFKSFVHEEGK